LDTLSIKQKRMLSYFIETTQKIIDRDGFDHVTIRKISQESGYNSATFYHYYEDLDHLLQFACVEYLVHYQNDLILKLQDLTDPLEIYVKTWQLFAAACYDHPKVFYHLFFSRHKDKIQKTFYQYLEIFDIHYDFTPQAKIFTFITLPDLFERHAILLEALAASGIIKNDKIHDKATMIIYIFESMLNTIRNDMNLGTKDEFIGSILKYAMILLNLDESQVAAITSVMPEAHGETRGESCPGSP
jgi:AcrR family transcriptional regulator